MGICAGRTRDLFPFSRIYQTKLDNGELYAYRELKELHPPQQGEHKKTLMFLHATNCSSIMLNTGGLLQQISHFAQDYHIIAPDFRGNGKSSYFKKLDSLWDLADDLKLFLDALGIKKVTIIGTCLGGLVSKLFAAKYKEYVVSLILVGALGINGGQHFFAKCNPFPKTVKDMQETEEFKHSNANILDGNREGVRKGADYYHPKAWVSSTNFDMLLDDMMAVKNLAEVFYGESQINISSKSSNKVINGSGDVKKNYCSHSCNPRQRRQHHTTF